MQRRIIPILLTVVLLAMVMLPTMAASASQFTDVSPSAWYYEAVDYVAKNGLFSGTSTTTFSPNTSMTRGMFVTVLGRFANADTRMYTSSRFHDVDMGRYFGPYVEWAADVDIVEGVTATKFSPDASITREQIAAILYRFAQRTGNDTTYTTDAYQTFSDKGSVSKYAQQALQWATCKGIIHGVVSDGQSNLRPRRTATRAEVAQMLLNSQDVLVKTEIVLPDDPAPTPDPGIVYWTPGGSVYHSTAECPTLARSQNIQSGTVAEAKAAGKDNPCKVCH